MIIYTVSFIWTFSLFSDQLFLCYLFLESHLSSATCSRNILFGKFITVVVLSILNWKMGKNGEKSRQKMVVGKKKSAKNVWSVKSDLEKSVPFADFFLAIKWEWNHSANQSKHFCFRKYSWRLLHATSTLTSTEWL